jgi:hypothetical protein
MIANSIMISMGRAAYLMVRENQSIGNDDVLSSTSSEDNDLGNIVWRQWFAAAMQY